MDLYLSALAYSKDDVQHCCALAGGGFSKGDFCVTVDEAFRCRDGASALEICIKTQMKYPKFKKINFW